MRTFESRSSRRTVADTVAELTRRLAAKEIPLLATIDHGGAARSVGLRLPDEVVLIFGNPLVGTAVMQADPRAGLDLPLRLLVWDDRGSTTVLFQKPTSMIDDYDLESARDTLVKLEAVLVALTEGLGS